MSVNTIPRLEGWRYGIHPRAAGMRVVSLGRVELPLGEALRLEFESGDANPPIERHLQYYVSTEAGPWALWLSCDADELPSREALLQGLEYRLAREP